MQVLKTTKNTFLFIGHNSESSNPEITLTYTTELDSYRMDVSA